MVQAAARRNGALLTSGIREEMGKNAGSCSHLKNIIFPDPNIHQFFTGRDKITKIILQ